MPSGKTHDHITWYCLPLVIVLFIIVTRQFFLTCVGVLAYLFSGFMFGPDLDIYSIQFKRWGFFRFLWLPYQKFLKHRSFFSHGFIIGTILRVIYLFSLFFIFCILFVAIAQLIFGFPWHWQKFFVMASEKIGEDYLGEVLSIFVGLELGAMSHYLADKIGSDWKSRQKRVISLQSKTNKTKTKRANSRTIKKKS